MTSSRVNRHRQAEAARRRVRTVGANRIGQRTVIPKEKPKGRRPKYQNAGMLGSFAGMCTALFAATGSIFWAVGAVGTGAGGAAAAWFEYRRDLIEVKRTGMPIGAKPTAPASHSTEGLSTVPEPTPVDLDAPRRRPATPRTPHRSGAAAAHMNRCQAKPPGGPTCRCPDGPNRKGGKRAPAKQPRRKT